MLEITGSPYQSQKQDEKRRINALILLLIPGIQLQAILDVDLIDYHNKKWDHLEKPRELGFDRFPNNTCAGLANKGLHLIKLSLQKQKNQSLLLLIECPIPHSPFSIPHFPYSPFPLFPYSPRLLKNKPNLCTLAK